MASLREWNGGDRRNVRFVEREIAKFNKYRHRAYNI